MSDHNDSVEKATTPKHDNPHLAKIRRDLNSPSASLRLRALKALKSPSKSSYNNFDIPYEMQNIITDEERYSPKKLKSFQEIMRDVIVYVEARNEDHNCTEGVKKVISSFGIKVNNTFLRNTTHVVFKDGLLSTYNKAKKMNIPVVSLQWIDKCRKYMKIVEPILCPIVNLEKYENPEVYGKPKRQRFFESPKQTKKNNPKKVNSDEAELSSESSIHSDFTSPSTNKTPLRKSNLKSTLRYQIQKSNVRSEESKNIVPIKSSTKNDKIKRRTIATVENMEETLIDSTKKRSMVKNKESDHSILASETIRSLKHSKRKSSIVEAVNMEETLKDLTKAQNSLKLDENSYRRGTRRQTSFVPKNLDFTLVSNDVIQTKAQNQEDSRKMSDETKIEIKMTPKQINNEDVTQKTPQKSSSQNVPCTAIKKRKLFVHDVFISTPSTPPLEKKSVNNSIDGVISGTNSEDSEFHMELSNLNKKYKKDVSRILSPAKQKNIFSTHEKTRRSTMDFQSGSKPYKDLYSQKSRQSKSKAMVCISPKNKDQIDFLKQVINKLGGLLEKNVSSNTTHVICCQTRRTMNLLRGMIRGLWILDYNWIVDSINQGKWLYEEEYEIKNFSRTIQICRSQREAFGKNFKMELFESVSPIYVSPKSEISQHNIIELILLCAGKIVKSVDQAKYIIGEFYEGKICVTSDWLLDSIINYRLKKCHRYLIKEHPV